MDKLATGLIRLSEATVGDTDSGTIYGGAIKVIRQMNTGTSREKGDQQRTPRCREIGWICAVSLGAESAVPGAGMGDAILRAA